MKLSKAKVKKGVHLILKGVKEFRFYKYYRTKYLWYREHCKLQEKHILVDMPKEHPLENVTAILKELATNTAYKEYKIYMAVDKLFKKIYTEYSKANGFAERIIFVEINSRQYYKLLATVKYLISETELPYVYIKRLGQLYLHVFLEPSLQKVENNRIAIGEKQKTFLDADYVVCFHEHSADKLIETYMLKNFATATILIPVSCNTISLYSKTKNTEKNMVLEKDIVQALCKRVMIGEKSSHIEERKIPYNGKENVLFYIGDFEKNGLTAAGLNLLHNLNTEKYNYGVIYRTDKVKAYPEELNLLPDNIPCFGYQHWKEATVIESVCYLLWKEIRKIPYAWISSTLVRIAKRSAKRILGEIRIHHIIQFAGYVEEMIAMAEQVPCKRTIYVHSDMEKEIRMRGNANKGLLSHAYKSYDNVAVITEEMIAPTKRIAESECGEKEANIHLCQNVIDYKRIIKMSENQLEFDLVTVMNVSQDKLLEVLHSNKKKFISIGRFSIEKGHERLIQAFEQLHKEQPDTCLIIVGGHGVLYEKTVKQVQMSSCPDSIFLVRYMSNPYPLLKQCDYFVLSSLYEGFGLVLVEADVLGLPCVCVDIPGPRLFMEKYGGMLVENSQIGILKGMQACMEGTVPKQLNIDYELYNKEAVAQFEALL